MTLSDFDYTLPEDLIAQEPVTPRDASRLLVLPDGGGPPQDRSFSELDGLLAPGDLLVFNDTKVIPARLVGRKATGGKVELLLCEPLEGGLGRRWRALGQASKPIRAGAAVELDGLRAHASTRWRGRGSTSSRSIARARRSLEALERAGRVPLPPYIRRAPSPRRPGAVPDGLGARAGERRRADGRAPLHRAAPRAARGAGGGVAPR